MCDPHDTDVFRTEPAMKCRFYLWEEHEINKGFRASVRDLSDFKI